MSQQYGTYSAIRPNKNKSTDFFDVLPDHMTNFDDPTTGGKIVDLDSLKASASEKGIAPPGREVATAQGGSIGVSAKKAPEQFWYKNPLELIAYENIFKIIPKKTDSLNGILNSITRLGILSSIALAILYKNPRYLIIGILVMVVIVVLYQNKFELLKKNTKS